MAGARIISMLAQRVPNAGTPRVTAIAAESYPILLVCAVASLVLLGTGYFVTADTWLALASGRVVADGGPPSTDTLMAWTLGREWVDQQWFGQFVLFELWRAGGLVLVGLVHAAFVTAALSLVVVGARLRGGAPRHVALVGGFAVLPLFIVAGNIRTQTFALLLFALVLWLLIQDSHAPTNLVFWCFLPLVLWANVHGSVILGAGLVALAGVLHLAHGLRIRTSRQVLHGALLLAIPPIALLCTPYGTSLFSYFGDVFGNTEIAEIAPEWMPISLRPVHAPFYILAGVTLVSLGRARRELTTFEQLTLLILLAAALTAVRHLAWFALAAVLLVPVLLTRRGDGGGRGHPPPARLAAGVSVGAVAAVLGAAAVGSGNVAQHVESTFPDAAAAAVADAARRDASLDVLAHPRYADWLLFRHPQLAARLAFDIRYELLSASELRDFRRFRDRIGDDWRVALGRARIVVLDRSEKPLGALAPTSAVLLRDPGTRQLYGGRDVAVILRPAHTAPNRGR